MPPGSSMLDPMMASGTGGVDPDAVEGGWLGAIGSPRLVLRPQTSAFSPYRSAVLARGPKGVGEWQAARQQHGGKL